ncbi:MAG: FHA domain-containing protein [Lentisphaeria bacterium]|nr:FHA domain-containing protein [Lentisphaeria bacterium]
MPQTTHCLALLFLDIPAALALRERDGNEAATDFVAAVVEMLGRVRSVHGGKEIRCVGNTMLSCFEGPPAALAAARAMRKLTDESRIAGVQPQVRIGLHWGEVSVTGRSVYGEAVSACARLVATALPGQILVTGVATEALSPEERLLLHAVEIVRDWVTAVGGVSLVRSEEALGGRTPERAAQETLDRAREFGTRTMRLDLGGNGEGLADRGKGPRPEAMLPAAVASEGRVPRLCLIRGAVIAIVDSAESYVSIGREEGNDILMDLTTASRRHAHVEMRGDAFYLIDHSWNGTFVYDEAGRETRVHNAELALRGSGVLCPGCPASHSQAEIIRYIETR